MIPTGFKVKLIRDLTRWHRSLKRGTEGETVGGLPVGRAAFSGGRFVRVKFAEIEEDFQLADLEITDPRWVEWRLSESLLKAKALLDHVAKATLWTTPAGGFVELVVESRGILEEQVRRRE